MLRRAFLFALMFIAAAPAWADFGETPMAEWSRYPRPANPIPTMYFLGFYAPHWNATVLDYTAKQIDYVWFDQSSFATTTGERGIPADVSLTTHVVRDIKAINPAARVGVYAEQAGGVCTFHLLYKYLDYTPSFSDFLHDTGGKVIPQDEPDSSDPNSVSPRCFFLNLGSGHTQQKVVNAWKDMLAKNPIDGIFFDMYSPSYFASRPQFANGCLEPNCNSENGFWLQHMTKLSQDLTQGTVADTVYNGVAYAGQEDGRMNTSFLDYHRGAFTENAQEIYGSTAAFDGYMRAVAETAQKGKVFLFWAVPHRDPALLPLIGLSLQRFYLASFLLVQQKPYTYFGFHPGPPSDGSTLYFYKDWNLDVGAPAAPYQRDLALNVYSRAYENGVVYVNPNGAPKTIQLPAGFFYEWGAADRLASGQRVLPAKTGVFYVKRAGPLPPMNLRRK